MIIQEYKEINGIKFFHSEINNNHSDYNSKGLDDLFTLEKKHFWFITRKEFIFNQIKNIINKKSKIIEIGAGTGNVSRYLMSKGYQNISVGEMHSNGLEYAKSYGISQCYQFDLLRSPFENEFDTICIFDVLEHIKDDNLAIQNIYKMLKKDGNIILTVPSHMWLWNRYDAIAGHKIRYTKDDLIKKLKHNGFEIITARYFFISIIPLLYLRTILKKDDNSDATYDEYSNDISTNSHISNILLFISRIENKINKFIPNIFGGSLFIIARKIDK